MRDLESADKEALAQAENRLQAISSGMYSSEDGEDATLQEQLISKFASFSIPKSKIGAISPWERKKENNW